MLHYLQNMYIKYYKRFFDVLISFSLLLAFSPLIITVGILLQIAQSKQPFFLQPRPGLGRKVFKVIKFKTMNEERDSHGVLLPDIKRLTKIGKFVRSTSLDELPQLINVLKGDMSLIGPRPLLVRYLDLYTSDQGRRHEVKPGITGWAQVNGRNAISWEKKFEYDVWYVDNISFALDLKILWLTARKVLKRDGISSDGQATTMAFKGSNR